MMKLIRTIFVGVLLLLLFPNISFATAPTASIIIPTGSISVSQGTEVSFSGSGTAAAGTVGTRNDYSGGDGPYGAAFDPVTNSIWVSNLYGYSISKFNITTGTRTDYPVGSAPRGVAFDPVTNSIWVVNTNSDTVSKVNITTGTRTDYPTGDGPHSLAFDPITNSVWVSNWYAWTVSKVNVTNGTRIDYPVPNSAYPSGVAFDPVTNSIWVANNAGSSISKFNVTNGTRIDYSVNSSRPFGLAFDSANNSMWVANLFGYFISKFNVTTVVKTDYNVGRTQHSLAFDPITNSIWATNQASSTVSKLDVTNGTRNEYVTGSGPSGIAFDSATNSVWVANISADTVSKISTGGNTITAYEWREGNCSTGTLLSSVSSFSKSDFTIGSHTVYLRVKDSQNVWSTNCPLRVITVVSPQPDLVAQNLTVSGTLTPQSTLTLSGNVTNQGIAMGTANSYNFRGVYPENTGSLYPMSDMVRLGNYVYTVSNRSDTTLDNFEIYDISNKLKPIKVFGTRVPGSYNPYFIESADNYLYVAAIGYSNNLMVYSISNPTSPVLVTSRTTQAPSLSTLMVQGNYLHVGANNTKVDGSNQANLEIYDITNRSNPSRVKTLSHPAGVSEVYALGNYLFVTLRNTFTGYSKLWIYNITNPATASKISELNLPNVVAAGRVNNLVAYGNYVYSGLDGNPIDVSLVNVSNPSSPSIASNIDFASVSSYWSLGGGASINFPYLYIANKSGSPGINTFNVSDPTNPKQVGRVYGNSLTSKNLFDETYLYGVGQFGFQILEPRVDARFCIDDSNCLATTTKRIGGKDFDAGKLNAGATYSTSTSWTATSGTHTIYFCADVKNTYGFDGVAELDETNNCTSTTFNVTTALPLVTISATPSSVTVGDSSIISWSTTNATSCTASGSWSGTKGTSGSESTGVFSTAGPYSYGLTCTGPGGTSGNSATVTVTAPVPASVCGNNICESGETPLTCPKDCKLKYKQF